MKPKDIIFVGAGPGSAIAAKIFFESGASVLMLEEGQIPDSNIRHHSLDEILKYYRNGGIRPILGRVPTNVVDVSVLGGGSVVNSGIYHDIPQDILEAVGISSQESAQFTSENITKYVKNALKVGKTPSSQFGDRLISAANLLELQSRMLPRWSTSTKSEKGWKHSHHSVYDSILKPLKKQGLKILTEYRVVSIKKENNYWKLSCLNLQTNLKEEFNAKIVVLGAGSIRTPEILRQSGLSKNAGNILRFHPMKRFIFAYPKNSYDFLGAVLPFQITHFLPNLTIGCSLSDPAPLLFWHPEVAKSQLRLHYDLVSHYVLTVPRYPAKMLFIGGRSQILHKFTSYDTENFSMGYSILSQLSRTAGSLGRIHKGNLMNISVPIHEPGKKSKIANSSLSSIHQYGSCRIGSSPDTSVIDYNFQVWGQPGLFVCDSSTIPNPIGVNPQGTVCGLSFIFATRLLNSMT